MLSFCNGIVKDVVKQVIWILHTDFSNRIFGHVVGFAKYNVWVNYCGFLQFLLSNFDFLLGMDIQHFSSFFQVVGLSNFGDNKFLHRKM